ncbi:lactose-specific phosphotransferase enzyme IIA component [Candidatus Malacoplasma girerdii]|uniref:Lactose-specific phosphotransferase enzyme IIA component n=1 Tax=Candidatus Malacoplasma girerdii TaxID=1318617 RepID=A0A097STE1_9BACT|nr:lactose-specific phosphotransferase enzyme IIA component [Candidatus Malacoplasma girerdii]ASJ89357.1 MAG: phosphotransferase system lactose-specific component EIIA [Candidatus Malacoplasma girerdii]
MKKTQIQATAYQVGFEIVALAGDARSILLQTIDLLKGYKKASATQKKTILAAVAKNQKEAKELLDECHVKQTSLLQAEAKGTKSEFSFLVVHAQDHLMTSLLLSELVDTFANLFTDGAIK